MSSDFLTNLVRRGAGLSPVSAVPVARIPQIVQPLLTSQHISDAVLEPEPALDAAQARLRSVPPESGESGKPDRSFVQPTRSQEIRRVEAGWHERGSNAEEPRTDPVVLRAPETRDREVSAEAAHDGAKPSVKPKLKPFVREQAEAALVEESQDGGPRTHVQSGRPTQLAQPERSGNGPAGRGRSNEETHSAPTAASHRPAVAGTQVKRVQPRQSIQENQVPVIRPSNQTQSELERRLGRAPAVASEQAARTIEVRIGSVEVRARTAQTAAASTRRELPPVEGFEAYNALRGYFGWHRE